MEDTVHPQAIALLTGHVIETYKIRNQLTDNEFIYANISTLGGNYDIVVDPEILQGDIRVNGVISGMFWLSGRIIDESLKTQHKNGKFKLHSLFNKK